MKTVNKYLMSLLSLLLFVLVFTILPACAADAASGSAKTIITEPTNGSEIAVENVTINLVAQGMTFNTTKITVPAGAHVTINFDNQDAGVPHNFALYENRDAQKTIFKGDVISGPKKIIYTFDAPTKLGTYFFRCDIHPSFMIGDFIVE